MGFNQDKLKLGVLWVIREYQPISLMEIAEIAQEADSNKLPVFVREAIAYYPWMGRFGAHYIEDLIAAGLVATVDHAPFNPSVKLTATRAMLVIRDLFSVSLTDLLTREPGGVNVQPVFGAPLRQAGSGAWARVFVAMPFAAELHPIYENHILKVTDALGVSCKRGDDFFSTNRIMSEVWSAIYHAEVCIVDCTGRNPNVFYELGIAHTIGRKAILIAQSLEDIPFDVRDFRAIEYQFPDGMGAFETKLEHTLRAELHLQSS